MNELAGKVNETHVPQLPRLRAGATNNRTRKALTFIAALLLIVTVAFAGTEKALGGTILDSAVSLPTAPGQPLCPAGQILNTALPKVLGAAVPSLTLSTDNGTWFTCFTHIDYYTYSWYSGATLVGTASTYTVQAGDVGKRVYVVVDACSNQDGCSWTGPTAAIGVTGYTAPTVVSSGGVPVYIDFHNNDGTWRIYVRCDPSVRVGPGYVSYMQMGFSDGKASGNTLLNETTSPSPPGATDRPWVGLGKFVYREARVDANIYRLTQGTNAFDVTSGSCNNANSPSPNDFTANGGGVDSANSSPITDLSTPANYWNASNGVSWVDQVVAFRDKVASADEIKVYYRWRISANVVQMWTNVVSLCSGGTCGVTGNNKVWIKGPKFISGIGTRSAATGIQGYPDSTNFTQWTVYDNSGNSVCTTNTNSSCASSARGRGEANYAGSPTCRGTSPTRCFEAVFEGYYPDYTTYTGTGPGGVTGINPGNSPVLWGVVSGCGSCTMFDWANKMDPPQPSQSTQDDGCTTERTPSTSSKWEEGGANGPSYTAMHLFAFGWRDCTDVITDPLIYALFQNGTPDYGTYATFSFNDNWQATFGGCVVGQTC